MALMRCNLRERHKKCIKPKRAVSLRFNDNLTSFVREEVRMPESITRCNKFRRLMKLAKEVFGLVLLVLEILRRLLDL